MDDSDRTDEVIRRAAEFEERFDASNPAKALDFLFDYGQRNRRLIRTLYIVAIVQAALILFVGALTVVVLINSSNIRAACAATNKIFAADRSLWHGVLTFAPPVDETPARRAQRLEQTALFIRFVDRTFAPQDCGGVQLFRSRGGS